MDYVVEQENKPRWLLELENRKRTQKLAHEAGAGAACLTCESACPGLDLHFWRKICKNCKCRGDEHDFNDDEFPQFELLFGSNIKDKKKRYVLLRLKDRKLCLAETPFEWIPADTTTELAEDYMKALPINKLPIKGSAGAAFRRLQLQKQLPLHDIDHQVCDGLSEHERKEFEKYLDNLKSCAGQGKVTKLMTIRPFDQSLVTPANATDVQRFSPQHSQQLLNTNRGLSLRTPSSFISKIPRTLAKSSLPNLSNNSSVLLPTTTDVIRAQHLQATNDVNPQVGKYHHASSNLPNNTSVLLPYSTNAVETQHSQSINKVSPSFGQYHSALFSLSNDSSALSPSNTDVVRTQHLKATNDLNPRAGKYHQALPNLSKDNSVSSTSSIDAQATNEDNSQLGQYHHTLPIISNVGSNPLSFSKDIIHAQHLQATNEVNPQLGRYYHTLTNVSSNGNVAEATTVPGTYHLKEQQSSNSSNQNNYSSKDNSRPYELKYSKIPNLIANEQYTESSAIHKADKTTLNELRGQTETIGEQNENYLEFPSDLPSNALLAEKMLSEALMPPSSVNASDIVGSSLDKKGLMYIRDKLNDKYSNKNDLQIPTMPREIDHISYNPSISNSEEVKRNSEKSKELKNQSAHPNEINRNQLPYLASSECLQIELNTSSPIQSNVIHSEVLNNPIFPEDVVGASVALQNPENISQIQEGMEGMTMNVTRKQKCHNCEDDILCGDVVVTAEKIKNAVWHPGCFVCSSCKELLVDLVYFTYKGKLYCGRDLAVLLEIPRCFACDELIFVREYTVAEGHNYHVKHFCCWDCDIPLAGQQYISENDRPLCLPCYQKNYAKTCNACNSVIAADQQGVAIKNLNFHATDDCFCCFTCKKSLLGGQIAIKENKLLCSKECITEFLHRKAL